MRKIILAFAALLSITGTSVYAQPAPGGKQADPAYVSRLNELMELGGSMKVYENVVNQMIDIYKQQFPDIPAEYWQIVREEVNNISLSELIEKLAPVYARYLTLEDLDGVIAFYKSPVGRKLSESTPMISAESVQIGAQWGMEIGKTLEAKLRAKIESQQ